MSHHPPSAVRREECHHTSSPRNFELTLPGKTVNNLIFLSVDSLIPKCDHTKFRLGHNDHTKFSRNLSKSMSAPANAKPLATVFRSHAVATQQGIYLFPTLMRYRGKRTEANKMESRTTKPCCLTLLHRQGGTIFEVRRTAAPAVWPGLFPASARRSAVRAVR